MSDKKFTANFGMAELESNWIEFEPMDERIGPVRLLLRPLSPGQRTGFGEAQAKSDRVAQVEVLADLIVDWNLENSEGPIDCNPENIKVWGDRLAHLRVELHPILFTEDDITEAKKEGGTGTFLGTQAIIFAGRPSNFLKN